MGGGEDAMVYSEFLEGIAATAHHKLSSPYICMAKRFVCQVTAASDLYRVDTFIAEFVLPKAHQKIKRTKRRSTARKSD